ncbi:MAG: hypothetical protein C4576_02450 [Desulfobacteraceae bacterium]|nr:MAG: hypothetical protein C4576_02450 [Desulfobacteraceae bacterium]
MPASPVVYCGDLIPADHGIFDRHPEVLENTGSRCSPGRRKTGFSTFYEGVNIGLWTFYIGHSAVL